MAAPVSGEVRERADFDEDLDLGGPSLAVAFGPLGMEEDISCEVFQVLGDEPLEFKDAEGMLERIKADLEDDSILSTVGKGELRPEDQSQAHG